MGNIENIVLADNVIYESIHSESYEYFRITTHEHHNFFFQNHLHRAFEITWVKEGQLTMVIDGETFELSSGDVILVKPYQIHSIYADCICTVCLFSPELIGRASREFQEHKLSSPMVSIRDSDFYPMLFAFSNTGDPRYKQKGFLYYLCDLFACCITKEPANNYKKMEKDIMVLHRILDYVEENFPQDVSLRALSAALNYSYSYLSKLFIGHLGIPYNVFVTRRRITHALFLLSETSSSIVDIANICGFSSIRSFNRNFKLITGKTPTDYR